MTFTPGTIERSKILKLGMSNGCFWIVQEMGEYPKTINVLGKECVSYKWLIKNVPGMLFDGRNILEYNKKMSQVFWNIDSWNKFYKKENITFAFSTKRQSLVVLLLYLHITIFPSALASTISL